MPPILVVAAAIVDDLDDPDRLLAARRSSPAATAGFWEFPGGKVEPYEEPEDALHRELQEELGVRTRLGREIRPNGGGTWPLGEAASLRLWLAVIVDGEPHPLEDHDELRWLSKDEWGSVPWLPADVAIVEALAGRTHA